MSKITPCLWFAGEAEEAVNFYVSVFKDGKIEGANISCNVTLDFGGMPFMLSYKGVVSAGQIKFTGEAAGMPFEFTVKKAG